MTVQSYAEGILLANTLEGKLAPPPPGLTLDPPRKGSYRTPTLPGRPSELMPRSAGDSRTKIPSAGQLGDEEHRSTLLHFFCNHELIAVELMALALLKFPDAPDAFRRGLLHTLQEEQEHTRLYRDRMAQTGTHFGDHTLSRMIWDLVAPMDSPLEYVSRLSLTFEQSNLDFAKHYSQAFAKVGDQESADLLAKIYHDEIAHVGHGLKWLRRFKQQKESDWDAWHNSLALPLSPIRAKAPEGEIAFNEEGRRKAGLGDDFIQHLKLYHRSRGRTPHVHFFNPNCEAYALAAETGKAFHPNENARDLEHDLEALILAVAHHEDVVLLRQPPNKSHLSKLKEGGLLLPEIFACDGKVFPADLAERKLGGFRPWAWTPEASQLFRGVAENPTPNSLHPWQEPVPTEFLSKALVSRVQALLQLSHNESAVFSSADSAGESIARHFAQSRQPLLLKPALACAGRGHLSVAAGDDLSASRGWLQRTFATQREIVIEPHLTRLADFSVLYEISRSGVVSFQSYTSLRTDSKGRYLGTTVAPKIGKLLPSELTIRFHERCIESAGEQYSAPEFYKRILPAALKQLLPGYQGPVAVDALFFTDSDGHSFIRPVVEINARCSMGRIAHHLRRKLAPDSAGHLTIHRRKALGGKIPAGLLLNDPATAKSYLATWESD